MTKIRLSNITVSGIVRRVILVVNVTLIGIAFFLELFISMC
ncbi:hypothetical protein MHH85_07620 [Viridibacillus sp. FSL E2-0187]